MDLVFNINRLGLEGLGATLTSLCRNCSDSSQLKIWFLCSELQGKDRENILYLLTCERFCGDYEFIHYDAKAVFGHLPSLHGDWTSYGRLLIPDYIASDSVLYLDADLIINLDVLSFNNYDLSKSLFGAVFCCKIAFALDHAFFLEKLNWPLEKNYFNSGVLLINLKRWREAEISKACHEITVRYPDQLLSHDQTILNAVSGGNYKSLPGKNNILWPPGDSGPARTQDCIIHFLGSPKPWDYFGNYLHAGFNLWKSYNTTAWQAQYNGFSKDKLARTWNIKKSIIRNLIGKLSPKKEELIPSGLPNAETITDLN